MVNTALVITVGGFVIPLLNALLTRLGSAGWVKTVVSIILAVATAAVAWAGDLTAVHDWQHFAVIALGAGLAAGGFKKAWLDDVESWLRAMTGGFGVGAKMTPEKAAAKHSHGTDLTVPVPEFPAQASDVPPA